MNGTVKVVGGKRLVGEVLPIPNKNAIVAALPMAVLITGETVFKNVPDTSDVKKILSIIEKLGGRVVNNGKGEIRVDGTDINSYRVDKDLGGSFRASLNFAGPLLARFGVAEVPQPGGCELGMRSIEAHTSAFEKLGVKLELVEGFIRLTRPKIILKKYRLWQIEASVSATENVMSYCAGIDSEVEIIDAACEPHVVDAERFLNDMGANIKGAGSNRIVVGGKKDLKGAEFEARPDFVDITGYMIAAAITDGEIKIKGANIPDVIDGIVNWMELFNVNIERNGLDLIVKRGRGGLKIGERGFPLAAANLPKFVARPWPGFPVDCLPPMVILASKCKGRLLMQNWMYESGLDFVRELNGMGADILMLDPQKIIVTGPVVFKGGEVSPPAVIQATKAVFLASLADPQTTVIHNFDILKRRYPDIVNVYRSLGAEIEKVDV